MDTSSPSLSVGSIIGVSLGLLCAGLWLDSFTSLVNEIFPDDKRKSVWAKFIVAFIVTVIILVSVVLFMKLKH